MVKAKRAQNSTIEILLKLRRSRSHVKANGF